MFSFLEKPDLVGNVGLLTNWVSSHCGAVEENTPRRHEVVGSIPGIAQWVKDLVSQWTVV